MFANIRSVKKSVSEDLALVRLARNALHIGDGRRQIFHRTETADLHFIRKMIQNLFVLALQLRALASSQRREDGFKTLWGIFYPPRNPQATGIIAQSETRLFEHAVIQRRLHVELFP